MSAPQISAVARAAAAHHDRGIILHRFVDASLSAVGPREFRGNAGSSDLQSDGFALDLLGGDLSRMQGGPLLWQHGEFGPDPVIGTVKSMTATATELPTLAEFLPAGADYFADAVCKKLKAGAPYGLSISFSVEEFERLPGGGRRATKWTAYELSLCAVPIDAKGAITARSRGMQHRNMDAITAAQSHLATALEEHGAAGRHGTAIADATERYDDHRARAGTALRACRSALQAGDHEQALEALGRCQRSATSMGRELRAVGEQHNNAMEAHANLTRAMQATEDTLNDVIQSSGGTDEDQGSRSADFRRRQKRLAELRAATPHLGDADYERRQRDADRLRLAAQD